MTRLQLKRMKEASEAVHKEDPPFKRASDREFIIYLLTVIVIALSIRTFVFEPVRVIGSSMFPTLVDGEGMFVEKLTYTFAEPEHGDIIICHYPGYTLNGRPIDCVKRVIGLPGDTVEILNGKVYLNGELLDESAYWNDLIFNDMEAVTVPDRRVFVMGDNRNASDDSRLPFIGPIPYGNIKGKVQAVMIPFSRAREV